MTKITFMHTCEHFAEVHFVQPDRSTTSIHNTICKANFQYAILV